MEPNEIGRSIEAQGQARALGLGWCGPRGQEHRNQSSDNEDG
jgi:hypothetical protein